MQMPWSHRLPDYTGGDSPYGQNLVQLAALLHDDSGPVVVIDVGANIGDSALQIADATDAVVICVEADPYYLEYLAANTAGDDRFEIVEALLVPSASDEDASRKAVRIGGTTRFVSAQDDGDSSPAITPTMLRQAHPRTERLRLVKSDTDGYDVAIVPAVVREWSERAPVVFFEYDPAITRQAGLDPDQVWRDLGELGYRDVAIWGNGGHPLGRATVTDMPSLSADLDRTPRERNEPTYWDVAVAHADDAVAISALHTLVPNEFSI